MKRKLAILIIALLVVTSLQGALAAVNGVIRTQTANGVVNVRSQGSAKKPVIGSVRNGASVTVPTDDLLKLAKAYQKQYESLKR